jgi:hypothetical protein
MTISGEPDALPIADTRQERIHQDDLANFGRVLSRIGIGDHQTNVMSDEAHLLIAELVHKFSHVYRITY